MEMTPHGALVEGEGSNRPNSGNWKNLDIAKGGWTWIRCVDSGDYPGPEKCQMCLMKHPRYLHTVEHPDHGRWTVGRICAAWMTGDPRAVKVEHELKLKTRREKRAELRALEKQNADGWNKSGANWRISRHGGKVTVFPNNGGYQIRWARRDHAAIFGDDIYPTAEAAKDAAMREMAKWVQ